MGFPRSRSLAGAVVCLAAAGLVFASDKPNLTEGQIRDFLLTADVIKSKETKKGITRPSQLTLRKGNLIHGAVFNAIDVRKPSETFATGRTELNFVDSYRYNIAAYELSKLVGLDHMIPVHVERKWGGKTGSLCWLVAAKWDEGDRLKLNLQPPDPDAWNQQMFKLRVFTQLVYDTDPNLGNWLITEDWKLWRIDFTRAFRLYPDLENPKNLAKCDRQLVEKLRQLNEAEVLEKTKPHLTKSEVKAVMARRDKILAHFQKLIAEKGESEVLY